MAVKRDVEGIDDLFKDLDNLISDEMIDAALIVGANTVAERLAKNFERFKDTGASSDEITVSEPYESAGQRAVRIHWQGPKNRYRIIHFNEWGTIKNPMPRGRGMVQKSIREGEEEYYRVLRREIERRVGR